VSCTAWVGARSFISILFVCLIVSGVNSAQQPANSDSLPVISSDAAKQNLLTSVQPDYPPLAKSAHIVGIINVEIAIDSTGNVSVLRLISGHPMLAPAALEAIRKWKYKPFQINGQTAAVRTEVQISIPATINQTDIDQERKFQDNYWPNERAGRDALAKHDLTTAENKLLAARAAADERGDQKWLELAGVVTMLGTVKIEQDDYEGAERFYQESLAIRQKHQRPDEAEVAGAQQTLGLLYFRMKQLDKAEPLFIESAKSYEARMKDTSLPEPLADYGRSLALDYFALSQIAAANGRVQESEDKCAQAVGYAEKWSNASDKEVIVSHCKINSPSK
jgi:TonB family protein